MLEMFRIFCGTVYRDLTSDLRILFIITQCACVLKLLRLNCQQYTAAVFFLSSYPMRPPVVRFITKIFHPNISRHGDIGLDSIHHNWSLALTISKVLISIQSLLTDPYVYVCMEPKIGRIYRDNRPLFDYIAQLWTWQYAMHDYLMPAEISASGPSTSSGSGKKKKDTPKKE